MAGPLSPLSPTMVNSRTPDTGPRTCKSIASFVTAPSATRASFDHEEINWNDAASSPFEMEVDENQAPFEIFADADTPSRKKSPVKTASRQHTPSATPPRERTVQMGSTIKSAKGSPLVDATPRPMGVSIAPPSARSSSRPSSRSPSKSFTARMQVMTIDEPTLRDNEGLTMAMNMMESSRSHSTTTTHSVVESEEYFETTSMTINDDANIDDTCFSTFSEIPNTDMTMFAKLGRSPTKQFDMTQVRVYHSSSRNI